MNLEQIVTVNLSAWRCWIAEIQKISSPCLRELTVNTVGVKTVVHYQRLFPFV